MPALTITTADHTTGQLTIPAHGLTTGDGACGLIAAGGALPAGGALVEGSDYWVIRDDANTIRLADSNAHALAGTALSFTDNGSGGQMYLLIGLPFRRHSNAAAGVQVKSAMLNGLQDDDVGGKRGVFRRNIPLTLSFVDATSTWAPNGLGLKSTSTAAPTVGASYCDVPYEVGDVVLGVEVWRKSDGTANTKGASLTLAASDNNIIIATTSSDTVASGATTKAKLVVPAASGIGHQMAAGETLHFAFAGNTSTGYIIVCAQLVVMRP